ncbi:MAG: hypothetical protein PHQ06_05565, partial [Atribacterota bacterium]|nr:hypothetical protein [Atribacterota bacterium]
PYFTRQFSLRQGEKSYFLLYHTIFGLATIILTIYTLEVGYYLRLWYFACVYALVYQWTILRIQEQKVKVADQFLQN